MSNFFEQIKSKLKEYAADTIHGLKTNGILAAALLTIMVILCICNHDGLSMMHYAKLAFLAVITIITVLFMPTKSQIAGIMSTILFLAFVPAKMFQRVEILVTGDMNLLKPGAAALNIFIYILLFAILFALTTKVNISFSSGVIISLLFALLQFYVKSFQGNMLTPSSLLGAKTAMEVMSNYDYSLDYEALYTVFWYLFFFAWGFKTNIKFNKTGRRITYPVVLISIIVSILVVFKTDLLKKHDIFIYNDFLVNNQVHNGTTASFVMLIGNHEMNKPAQYSEASLNNLYDKYSPASVSPEIKPNIIFVMIEGFSDLRVLGDIDTNIPFMPFIDSLRNDNKNAVSGNCHVNILGGLTCNSEYEALSGDSLALMSSTALPYNTMINHTFPSLASILNSQGYYSEAMHTWTDASWNRRNVYEYMGFSKFTSADFGLDVDIDYYNDFFVSDDTDVNEIIYLYENRDITKPYFLFNVTVQNHSPTVKSENCPIEVTYINDNPDFSQNVKDDLEGYLEAISYTDKAIEKLINYFDNVDEPTIICFFGDHQPTMPKEFYETMGIREGSSGTKQIKKYITPYVIWSNYDNGWKDYGDVSANYLSAILLECASLSQTPYTNYLLDIMDEYPVLSLYGCIDKSGNYYNREEISDALNDYYIFQYNHLFDEVKDELFR